MPAVQRRIRFRRGSFPLTVEEELADFERGISHRDLYAWRLSKYLLPSAPGPDTRQAIEAARDHEARMWLKFPDGPESLGRP
jgi:hypothetical protein